MALEKVSPAEMVALVNLFAISFAESFDTEDLGLLGEFFVAAGDMMALIATQQELNKIRSKDKTSSEE